MSKGIARQQVNEPRRAGRTTGAAPRTSGPRRGSLPGDQGPASSREELGWRTRDLEALLETVVQLETTEEARSFFRDLCTISELEAMAHRWQVARLLAQGLPYLEVAERTGASTTTVTRVAHWLRYGEGGYRRALERLTSPVGR